MFTRSSRFYDLIYSSKNYRQEVDYLLAIVHARVPGAKTILDVACGTGEHLRFLPDFNRTGLDLDPELLRVARAKLPDVSLIQSDMTAFDLSRQFDVVLCLFSAIGYAVSVKKLNASVCCMARHVAPGGILCIEPWFTPEQWLSGRTSMRTVEEGNFKVAEFLKRGGAAKSRQIHFITWSLMATRLKSSPRATGWVCLRKRRCAVHLKREGWPLSLIAWAWKIAVSISAQEPALGSAAEL